jgi:hypothetical protein
MPILYNIALLPADGLERAIKNLLVPMSKIDIE